MMLITTVLFTSCSNSDTGRTEYSKNKYTDLNEDLNYDEIAAAIGEENFYLLTNQIGTDSFDRLGYGTGQSNIILLLNAISDMNKLIQLLSGDNAMSPEEIVRLLDMTDRAVIAENPPSDDTIAKIAHLINIVTDMDSLKDIVHGMEYFNNKSGMERLAYLLALVDENSSAVPSIINQVANTTEGKAVLLRLMNNTEDMRTMAIIMNNLVSISNMSGIMNNVTNTGAADDGIGSLIVTMNKTIDPVRLATIINNLNVSSVSSNDDNFDGPLNNNWAVSRTAVKNLFEGRLAPYTQSRNNTNGWEITGAGNDNPRKAVTAAAVPLRASTSYTASVVYWSSTGFLDDIYFQFNDNGWPESTYYFRVFEGQAGRSTVTTEDLGGGFKRLTAVFTTNAATSSLQSAFFDSDTEGLIVFMGDIKLQEGTGGSWTVSSYDTYNGSAGAGCIGIPGVNPLYDGETASTELIVNLTVAGAVTYARTVRSEAGHDFLNFYVDDILVHSFSGQAPWSVVSSPTLSTGIHRLRWEYTKDASGSGDGDYACIDNLEIPGNRGAVLPSYMKVAILFNQLTLTAQYTVSDILNETDSNGLNTLTYMLNRVAYPLDPLAETPRFIAIVNNLSAVGTLTNMMNNLTGDAPRQVCDLIDGVIDISKLYGLINGLTGGPGERMYQIMNSVTSTGNSALVRLLDRVSMGDILTIMNGVSKTLYMPQIYNNLDLSGTICKTIGADSSPTGGRRLADLINEISNGTPPGNNLTLGSHLVRLINDISAGSGASGAANIGKLFSGLSNTVTPGGVQRMTMVMDDMAAMDPLNIYNDSYQTGLTDRFGRLTTFLNNISGDSAGTAAKLINNTTSSKLTNLTYLIGTAKRVKYVTEFLNSLTNADLLTTLLSDTSLNPLKMRQLVDCTGDRSYPTNNPPSPRYSHALDTTFTDTLGRLAVLINEVVTANGATNMVSVMNNVTDQSKVSGLIAGININGSSTTGGGVTRIRYLSDIMNNVANINLMINILNGPEGQTAADYPNLVKLINEVGASTKKGNTVKPVGDLSIVWSIINLLGWDYTKNAPRTAEQQSRIISLVNNVNKCGVNPAFELNNPWNNLIPEPCSTGNKRLSDFMLGMNNSFPASVIVGEVTDTMKTVKLLNGMVDIQKLMNIINYLPGEVTRTYINTLDNTNQVIYGSALFLMNRLSDTAICGMIHYGTGIGEGSSRNAACNYFTGIGPMRMGRLLNAETGPRLLNMLGNFGWRTSVPAMVCGFGVVDNQSIDNLNGGSTQYFPAVETIQITGPHYVNGAWVNSTYTHRYGTTINNKMNCLSYYSENVSVCGMSNYQVDDLLWNGNTFWCVFVPITINKGITSVWDIINEEGFVYALLDIGLGKFPMPPALGTTDKNWPKCKVCPDLSEPAVQYGANGTLRTAEFTYPEWH
jgi:hypothetical protein